MFKINEILFIIYFIVKLSCLNINENQKKTLIITSNKENLKKFSILIDHIKKINSVELFDIESKTNFQLEKYGEFKYNGLIILGSLNNNQKNNNLINANQIKKFTEKGKPVFALIDNNFDLPKKYLISFGIKTLNNGNKNFHSKEFDNELSVITGRIKNSLKFDGIYLKKINNNKFLYTLTKNKKENIAIAFQNLKDTRALILGSYNMCQDKYSELGNKEFCRSLLNWTFGEKGKIKIDKLSDYPLKNQNLRNSKNYLTTDDSIVFSLSLKEYKNKKWNTFIPKNHIQTAKSKKSKKKPNLIMTMKILKKLQKSKAILSNPKNNKKSISKQILFEFSINFKNPKILRFNFCFHKPGFTPLNFKKDIILLKPKKRFYYFFEFVERNVFEILLAVCVVFISFMYFGNIKM